MKVGIMLNGMVQMLDFLDGQEDVYIEFQDGTGKKKTIIQPLKSIRSGSEINGVILTTIGNEQS